MSDLAAIRERHVPVTLPKGDNRERTRWQGCDFDEQPWPCDAAQLLALLADTPSVEPAGLADALDEAYEWIHGEVSHSPVGPDHACAECVPGGPIVVEGFRCVPHVAAAHRARLPTQASDSPEKTT